MPIDSTETAPDSPARVSCVPPPRFKSGQVMANLCREFPEMKAKGFRAAVRALVPGDPDVRAALLGFLPDGYCILPESREVHAIEVVDTSPMDFNKGGLYAHLGEILEDEEWMLSVAAFDYAGGLICHLPYYCFARYYTDPYAGQEMRDVLPAAMAAARSVGQFGRYYGPMRHEIRLSE